MTISVTPAGTDTDPRDRVVAELSGYGHDVDCAAAGKVVLRGRNVLWLVTAGTLDLFAVDADQQGRWHFLGRLEPGSVLPGAVKGPKHTLVGRPLAGCALRRLHLGEVIRAQRDEWVHQRPAGGGPAPQELAVATGVDLGLRVLLEPPTDRLPPRDFVPLEPGQETTLGDGVHGRSVDGILWLEVVSGRVRLGATADESVEREAGELLTVGEKDWVTGGTDGAVVRARGTAGLVTDDRLWPNLLNHQARLLYTLDRRIERLDRTYDQRMRAGQQAGEAVREAADRSLMDVIELSGHRADTDTDGYTDNAVLAAARLVARESGIDVVPAAGGYPRWFVSVGVRVRGGVPSPRPVYTVFTQQATGAPWLAGYTDDPGDTVPAVRTNAAGAVAAPTSTSGLLMDPADLSAAVFAHAVAPTTPTDRFAHTAALDDQLSAGLHVGAQTLAAKGWTYGRVLDPTSFPRYLLTTTDGGVLAFTATIVVDRMEARAGHQVELDAGSNEAALDGLPEGMSARRFTIRRLQTFLTYIPPKGSGQKVQVLAYNDAPISVQATSEPSRTPAPGRSATPGHSPSRVPEPSRSAGTPA
jgi:hypothetical protein